MANDDFDSTNKFLVTCSATADETLIMAFRESHESGNHVANPSLTKAEALNLVAWVSVMADLTPEEIASAMAAVTA